MSRPASPGPRFGPALVLALLVAATAPAGAADTDDQLIARVRGAIVRNHLFARPDCVKYQILRRVHPRVDEVDVFERHDATCGGDPDTEPRVFNFRIDRATGEMATTALDPDGLKYVRVK